MAQDFATRYTATNTKEDANKRRGAVPIKPPPKKSPRLLSLQSILGVKLPAWGWLASGLLVGSFVGYLLALASFSSQMLSVQQLAEATQQPNSSIADPTTASEIKPEAKKKPLPKFEFYTELTTSQVQIPSIDAYKSTPRAAEDQPEYLIQAGSFNNLADAQKQKVRVENLGFNQVKLTSVETASGAIWYRIQLGPEQDRRELAKIQNTLNRAGIDSLRVKVTPAQQHLALKAVEPLATERTATEQITAEPVAADTLLPKSVVEELDNF